MKYPPHNALVNVVVRAPDARSALADAATLATHLRGRAHAGRFLVLGPAPGAGGKAARRVSGRKCFSKGSHRGAMREAVQAPLAAEVKLQRRVAIDIDPVSIL
jgi:primosomal protein N'